MSEEEKRLIQYVELILKNNQEKLLLEDGSTVSVYELLTELREPSDPAIMEHYMAEVALKIGMKPTRELTKMLTRVTDEQAAFFIKSSFQHSKQLIDNHFLTDLFKKMLEKGSFSSAGELLSLSGFPDQSINIGTTLIKLANELKDYTGLTKSSLDERLSNLIGHHSLTWSMKDELLNKTIHNWLLDANLISTAGFVLRESKEMRTLIQDTLSNTKSEYEDNFSLRRTL